MLAGSTPTPASRTVMRTRSAVSALGPYQQSGGPLVKLGHRIQGVADEVEHHLLQLNAIAAHSGKIVGELQSKLDIVTSQVTRRESDDFSRGVVQVERLEHELLLAEQRAQASDHFRRAIAIAKRAPRRLARAINVGRRGIQHPHAGAGVRDDARQRLIHFVRDRSGQRAESRPRATCASSVRALFNSSSARLRSSMSGADAVPFHNAS